MLTRSSIVASSLGSETWQRPRGNAKVWDSECFPRKVSSGLEVEIRVVWNAL
jgi:hypothetical protein